MVLFPKLVQQMLFDLEKEHIHKPARQKHKKQAGGQIRNNKEQKKRAVCTFTSCYIALPNYFHAGKLILTWTAAFFMLSSNFGS